MGAVLYPIPMVDFMCVLDVGNEVSVLAASPWLFPARMADVTDSMTLV